MLGDIVSNNSRPNAGGTATAVRPASAPRMEGGGYGSSNFGEAKPLVQTPRPVQPQPAAFRPQPIATQPQPVAAPVAAQSSAAAPTVQPQQPVAQPAAAPVITALPPIKTKKASKLPLILTIVGGVVFIGGVVGLFVYALSGQ